MGADLIRGLPAAAAPEQTGGYRALCGAREFQPPMPLSGEIRFLFRARGPAMSPSLRLLCKGALPLRRSPSLGQELKTGIRPCLKTIKTPKQRILFHCAALKFFEIHKAFLQMFAPSGEKIPRRCASHHLSNKA